MIVKVLSNIIIGSGKAKYANAGIENPMKLHFPSLEIRSSYNEIAMPKIYIRIERTLLTILLFGEGYTLRKMDIRKVPTKQVRYILIAIFLVLNQEVMRR
jgi:hypothetical protein